MIGRPALDSDDTKKQTEEIQDTLRYFLKDIRKYPLLSENEEITLVRLVKEGNVKAREQLINSNLRLVISIAKKYQSCGLPFSDLIEEGNFGLFKAVKKFNPEMGSRFSTYATWWIRHYIIRALDNKARLIRLPVNLAEVVNHFITVRTDLAKKLGREPTFFEMATEMSLKPEQIERILVIIQSRNLVYLEAENDDQEENSPKGIFQDTRTPSPEELFSIKERKDYIDNLLNLLKPREKEVIQSRFGLNGNEGISKTLEEIGKNFGLTRERVRQIEKTAIEKLGRILKRRGITLSDLL